MCERVRTLTLGRSMTIYLAECDYHYRSCVRSTTEVSKPHSILPEAKSFSANGSRRPRRQ